MDKLYAHRRARRAICDALLTGAEVLPTDREFFDPWSAAKDGKMRFDPVKFPHLMRK